MEQVAVVKSSAVDRNDVMNREIVFFTGWMTGHLGEVRFLSRVKSAAPESAIMPGTVFMRGKQVTLTTIRPEDYAFIEQQFNDPSNRRRAGMSVPWSERTVEDFVEDTDETAQFLVCRDGTPVGHIVLTALDTQASNAELGWIVISPEEQGNGFATEAVDLCLTHAFDDRGLHKVWARVNEDNEASIRLLETYGFDREGTLRDQEYADGEYVDVYRYGLFADEWTSGVESVHA